MTENYITQLHTCSHCSNSGTCKNGKDGQSCTTCTKKASFFSFKDRYGEVCSVCKGVGVVEPMSLRLKYRTGPVIALLIMSVVVSLALTGSKDHFSEVLAFLSTLTGAVTGFYFSSKKDS